MPALPESVLLAVPEGALLQQPAAFAVPDTVAVKLPVTVPGLGLDLAIAVVKDPAAGAFAVEVLPDARDLAVREQFYSHAAKRIQPLRRRPQHRGCRPPDRR